MKVVVRAGLEALDPVLNIGACREQDDGQIPDLCTDALSEVEARAMREHDVQDGQVKLVGGKLVPCLSCRRRRHTSKAFGLEGKGDDGEHLRLVIDDKCARRDHSSPPGCPCGNSTTMVVPTSGRVSTMSFPPCAATIS